LHKICALLEFWHMFIASIVFWMQSLIIVYVEVIAWNFDEFMKVVNHKYKGLVAHDHRALSEGWA